MVVDARWNGGLGVGALGMVWMVVFWGAIIGLFIWGIRRITDRPHTPPTPTPLAPADNYPSGTGRANQDAGRSVDWDWNALMVVSKPDTAASGCPAWLGTVASRASASCDSPKANVRRASEMVVWGGSEGVFSWPLCGGDH